MAAAEIEGGARLFYRRPEANTWSVLNVREAFAADHPEAIARVLSRYEQARAWAAGNPAALQAMLVAAMKLPEAVVARQLERTDLSSGRIGPDQDVAALTRALIDPSFADRLGT